MLARTIFTVFILLAFILSGCSNTQGAAQQNDQDDELNEEHLIFFSDDQNMENEIVYYDVILDLKKDFPEQILNMEVLDNTDGWQEHVDTMPCLILVSGDKIVAKAEGSSTEKDEIYHRFYEALEAAE